MKIGSIELPSPFVVAPMAGMTDTAFPPPGQAARRLRARRDGDGLVRGARARHRSHARYAEYTEEERPVSIQIFGGDPVKMADAAQIVEAWAPTSSTSTWAARYPKIAKHNAGCSLMREPEHAARVIEAMAKAVKIPVTVKMRAGWNDSDRNAPVLAQDGAGCRRRGGHDSRPHGRAVVHRPRRLGSGSTVASDLQIPVFGSGDCVEPEQIVERMNSGVGGVLVGRGVLRNPWILAQAADLVAGRTPRTVTLQERGQFLLDYIDLLLDQREHEQQGFRHVAPGASQPSAPASGHERWVINKLRALCAWYSKGLDSGSHLRVAVNSAESISQLRHLIEDFFMNAPATV